MREPDLFLSLQRKFWACGIHENVLAGGMIARFEIAGRNVGTVI
jgi:hypothetical protein